MTRNIRNFFTGIVLVACIFCLCGAANAATSVSILPSVETVAPGEEFTLDVYVKPDTQIAALQFDLNSDCSLVMVKAVEEGNLFSNTGSAVFFRPGIIDSENKTVFQVYGAIMGGDGTSDEGTFCTIKLKASEETGNCQIRITNIVVGDKQGDELDVITYDAMVSISDEIATSDRDNDNDDDTELNIIEKQDDNTDSSVNEETIFQSVQDTAESTESQEIISAPESEGNTSNISILAVAAIVFLALAIVLDRKRK
ncbi:cohesin domain-containing protein [Methanolobus vulcani]|nr:cohesin domain-containing protein [Methanolobus vulcani]